MSNNIIDFGGKYKGKQISECDTKYLKWLVAHERVLALRNRWASRDARFELERREMAAAEAAMAVKVAEEIIAEAITTRKMSTVEAQMPVWIMNARPASHMRRAPKELR
jgi:hypothetical protein